MAYKDEAVDTEKRASPVLPVVGLFPDVAEGWEEDGARSHVPGARLDGGSYFAHDVVGHAFHRLDDDVAGEAVGDDDVRLCEGDVAALEVADEVDVRRPEKLRGFLGEGVALGVLLADVEEGYFRVLPLPDTAHIGRRHLRPLDEVLRLRVGVGTDVKEDRELAREREEAGEGRPLDATDAVEVEDGAGHDGAGVTGGDEGVGLAVPDEPKSDDDRGLLLLAGGPRRLFVHGDDLRRVDDSDGVGPGVVVGQLGLDRVLRPDEGDSQPRIAGGPAGALDDGCRSVVAAHRVEGDYGVVGHQMEASNSAFIVARRSESVSTSMPVMARALAPSVKPRWPESLRARSRKSSV